MDHISPFTQLQYKLLAQQNSIQESHQRCLQKYIKPEIPKVVPIVKPIKEVKQVRNVGYCMQGIDDWTPLRNSYGYGHRDNTIPHCRRSNGTFKGHRYIQI